MIERLLIANRGEIAVRVARTAKRMGIHVIAVYSDTDAAAMHVAVADEAVRIGPDAAAESYLNIDAVIAAARETRADAIHPGYGFLSENADFADACVAAEIRLVGPSADAMRAMGDKAASKEVMSKADVPLVPGYHGADQDPAMLAKQAAEIGFPVLIKASAGGGGRGMRIVESADAFDEALAAAQREARGAFGNDRVLIEKYLTTPRHIEVQVFGDDHGNVVHLFERDCSQAPAGASAWVQAKEHSLVWKVGNDICRGWCFKKGSLFRRRGKFNQKKGTWSRGSSSLLANGLDDVRFAVYHDQQGNEFLSHVACWMIAGGVKTKRLVRISNGRYYTH